MRMEALACRKLAWGVHLLSRTFRQVTRPFPMRSKPENEKIHQTILVLRYLAGFDVVNRDDGTRVWQGFARSRRRWLPLLMTPVHLWSYGSLTGGAPTVLYIVGWQVASRATLLVRLLHSSFSSATVLPDNDKPCLSNLGSRIL